MTGGLAVIETHPIQYHVPVYRALQREHGVAVTAIYGSDFSVRRYRDHEFGVDLAWDVDLLDGLDNRFLSRVGDDEVEADRLSARGVGAHLDALRPHAVLIVGYSPHFHRQAWFAAWRRGLPVLFRGEAADVGQSSSPFVSVVRDLALRVAYRSCARVLYIGRRAHAHYRARGVPEARLTCSPYCVDVTPFRCAESDRGALRSAARRELAVGDDALVVLFSGKLSERKGVDLLVPAIATLPAMLRTRVLVVCLGDGHQRSSLVAAADAACVPLIVIGVQPQQALSRWYHAADMLVLPSLRSETWGLVVNEALHHGLPVVVSDRVGCAPDLVTASTGAVCAAGSVEALRDGIERVQPLVGRLDVREACRAHVDAYSVERAAAGLAEAYMAATNGRTVA